MTSSLALTGAPINTTATTAAGGWCLDLWKPLDDLTLEEAVANIYPTVHERNFGITAEHLIDDYVLSRNIARYGLKFRHFEDLQTDAKTSGTYFFHNYLRTEEQKIDEIKSFIKAWELEGPKEDEPVTFDSNPVVKPEVITELLALRDSKVA